MLPSNPPRPTSIPDLIHQPAVGPAHSSMHTRSTQTQPHTDAGCNSLPVGDYELAAEVASDGMSQLSSQTQQHMDTASHSAFSDDDMLDDDQAAPCWGRPIHPSNATAASHKPPQATDRCTDSQQVTDSQEASDRRTENHQASDTCTSGQCSQGTCTDTCQASDRQTGAAEMPVSPPPPFQLARSRRQYLRDVEACQQALYDGDSYEICLTTALVRDHPLDPLQLYRTLRRVNPAPYAAWLSFGGNNNLQICCASPERFLKVRSFMLNN